MHAAAGGPTLRLSGMGDGGDESGQHAEKSRLRLSPQSLASDPDSAGGTRLSAMATWTERAKMLTGRREDAVRGGRPGGGRVCDVPAEQGWEARTVLGTLDQGFEVWL